MALTLMLALQAAAAAPAPAPPIAPIRFDLASLRAGRSDPLGRARGCTSGDSAEILVCGRRSSTGAYPLAEMTRRYAPGPIRAETRLFGSVVGRAYGESVVLDRGAVSHRAMIGIRLPF